MKRYCLIITAFLLIFTFCACDFDESNNSFRGGELLDNDMMSELKDKYITEGTDEASEETKPPQTENKTEKQTEKETGLTIGSETMEATEVETETLLPNEEEMQVYWTKSGSVWHTTDQCHHLKKSKNIESGSVEEAIEAGKSKACSSCGK